MPSATPYDPYDPQEGLSSYKTAAIQAQLDDTVDIMRGNIDKVAQNRERLDAIDDQTANLAQSARGFRGRARIVRRRMWWKDMKMRLCIILGIIILLIVIIVPIAVHFS